MGERVIVWDLGGVVLRWEPESLVREALSHLAPDEAAAAELTARVFEGFGPDSDWSQFDRGTLDAASLATRIGARTGIAPRDVEALLEGVPAHLQVRAEAVDVVQELRAAGHRTLYLSNMPTPLARMLRENGFTSLFDGGVFSCDTGHVKPEPAIFSAARELLGLDLTVTTFVDDREVNVDAARAAGWDAVLFTGPDDVRDRLLAYNGG